MVLMATATAANPLVKSLGQIPWSTPPGQTPLQKPLKTFYKPFQTSIKPFKIVINVQGGGALVRTRAVYISVGPQHVHVHTAKTRNVSRIPC